MGADGGTLRGLWDGLVAAPLRRANAEARAFVDAEPARGCDYKTLVLLLVAVVMLVLQHYLFKTDEIRHTAVLLRDLRLADLADRLVRVAEDPFALPALAWWATGTFICWAVVPALVVRFIFRDRLVDYGLRWRGAFTDLWLYPLMLAVMAPLVLVASRGTGFQLTYPFYEVPPGRLWPGFWCWEMLYALQFVAVEFFFRGFLVHGLRHRLGAYAIPVMTIPYCMIHYGKPLPETLAAIPAGLVLGLLSLKSRSIFLGVLLHVSVALSMDLASLWRRGYFG
jgi:membrane protease YdiL (CAAX protease family)